MKYFGYKIKFIHNLFRQKVEKNEIIQKSIISRTEFMILAAVKNSSRLLCLKDIQEHFSINRSTTSELLSGLENKDIIIKQVDENDSRIKYIVVTDYGKSEYEKIVEQFNSIDRDLIQCLSQEEMKNLENILDKLIKFNIYEKEGEKNEEIYCCKKKEN